MEKFKEYGEMGKAALIKSSEHATGLSRDLGISASKGAALASSAKSLGASMGMNGDMAVKAAGEIYGSLKGTETSYRDWETDRKSTRLNSSHLKLSRMPSFA